MFTRFPAAAAGPAALVVALHGCTQDVAAYIRTSGWLALADRFGFALLAPEQRAANNVNRCFNWFEPADTTRGSGETASIASMIQHMVQSGSVDPARVFVTGLSAGGAMSAVLLARHPETFAGGAVVAGLPFGAAGNLQEALAAMQGGPSSPPGELAARLARAAPEPERRPRLSIWHGAADRTVVPANAWASARQYVAGHRLADESGEARSLRGRSQVVWAGPDGEPLVELNLIAGLGHGTPVAAAAAEPVGEVAPFSLEAGVSSSLEIARFWGLASPAKDEDEWTDAPSASEPASTLSPSLAESVLDSVSPHVPEDVRQVIANALASAGLRR